MKRVAFALIGLPLMLAACDVDGPPQEPDTPFAPEGAEVPLDQRTDVEGLPANLPAYLAPVRGATVTSGLVIEGGGILEYTTPEPLDVVVAHHRNAARSAGQEIGGDLNTGNGHMLTSPTFAANFDRNGDVTSVSITYAVS